MRLRLINLIVRTLKRRHFSIWLITDFWKTRLTVWKNKIKHKKNYWKRRKRKESNWKKRFRPCPNKLSNFLKTLRLITKSSKKWAIKWTVSKMTNLRPYKDLKWRLIVWKTIALPWREKLMSKDGWMINMMSNKIKFTASCFRQIYSKKYLLNLTKH